MKQFYIKGNGKAVNKVIEFVKPMFVSGDIYFMDTMQIILEEEKLKGGINGNY